jgi:hypothetical protein
MNFNELKAEYILICHHEEIICRKCNKKYEFAREIIDRGYNFSQDNILSQSDEFCEWALQILK